ncbi:hypothetical protein CEE86_14625, partial [Lactobacillus crispatus]|uniref:hypothetical protein n=1 Tax=Lactobacillus crispatus TaxID=47770 RepID=UPI0010E328A1
IITRVGNIDSKPLIINVAGSEGLHASLTFPEGKTKAYWPPSLSLNMTVGERAIYSLSFADGAAEKIEFVVIGTRGIDESDVLAFGNAGCLGQAADALNKLARTQNRRSFD